MDREKTFSNSETPTIEQALYALAFVLALAVRLLALGHNPLTEYEASWANQALALSRGQSSPIGPQPLYVLFTTLAFWLVRADEAWARLLPVLCGSLLVITPPLFRRWSGSSTWARRASLIMAFILALDPALVALSRQAGGSMPAVALLILAFGLGVSRRWSLAGVAGGLALLAGPGWAQGLLGLGLAWGVNRLLDHFGQDRSGTELEPDLEEPDEMHSPDRVPVSLRTVLLFGAGTVLLAGTVFMRFPQGLGALASTLPAYLKSWIPGTGDLLPAPVLRLPLALLVYQPLLVIFGIVATLRVWLDGRSAAPYGLGQKFSLWAALALLAAMLSPNRQVADLAWGVIPLAALAALELARCLPEADERPDLAIISAHAGITALFSVLFIYNLLRLSYFQAQPWLYMTVLLGIALMIVVISFLVAAGWSIGVARLGIAWGSALVLAVVMLSNLWYSAFLNPSSPGDLWGHPPAAGQVQQFQQTLGDLSEWRTSFRNQLDVLVTVDSAALRWQLRSFPHVRYATSVATGDLASVIITTQDQPSLDLAVAYRGQDFIWWQYPGWNGVLPTQWLDWLYFHQAPSADQQIILWARSDLFPGGSLSPNNSIESQPFPSE